MSSCAYQFGSWLVEPALNRMTSGTVEKHLEPLSMDVLSYLLAHSSEVVSLPQLLQVGWSNRVVEDNAVPRVINEIRRALGDDSHNPRYIETIRKRGYRTVAAVERSWASDSPAIAVLPLRNIGPDKDQEHLGDAVSHEIHHRLTRVEALRVISMTSSSAYRDSALDVREIGRELTADLIIEGAFARTGSLLRLNIHLTDTRDGIELWGTCLTEHVDDTGKLFAVYDEISTQIGRVLSTRIRGTVVLERSAGRVSVNLAAYETLQKALAEFRRTSDALRTLDLVRQAIELDPQYPEAYAAAASYQALVAEFGYGPSRENFEAAEQWVDRALELDADCGMAYVIRGFLLDRLQLDFRGAMDAYRMAEKLCVDPVVHAAYIQDTLLNAGLYEEGVHLTRERIVRTPGDGNSRADLGRFLFRLNRREEATAEFRKAIKLSPRNARVIMVTTLHLLWLGQLQEVEEILEEQAVANPLLSGPAQKYLCAKLASARGDPSPLEKWLQWVTAHRAKTFVNAMWLCDASYEVGDLERHVEWFAIRVQERDHLGWVMDEMRRHPDYWERFLEWSLLEPSRTRERLDLVNEHRALVDRITERMVV